MSSKDKKNPILFVRTDLPEQCAIPENLRFGECPVIIPDYERRVLINDCWYEYLDVLGLPSNGYRMDWTHLYFHTKGQTLNYQMTPNELAHAQKMHKIIMNSYQHLIGHQIAFQYRENIYEGTLNKVDFQTATLTLQHAQFLRKDQEIWFQIQVKLAAEKKGKTHDT